MTGTTQLETLLARIASRDYTIGIMGMGTRPSSIIPELRKARMSLTTPYRTPAPRRAPSGCRD